jgi:hypothetical protein
MNKTASRKFAVRATGHGVIQPSVSISDTGRDDDYTNQTAKTARMVWPAYQRSFLRTGNSTQLKQRGDITQWLCCQKNVPGSNDIMLRQNTGDLFVRYFSPSRLVPEDSRRK